ncbi:D-alanyl-D-alanine carboxypeptidase/D-alanyl-D-alanine-endopeptidase [Zobellella taiwanensis]|uniref:D-alanyl-D-alanine carboxypeptidase/D-alanyl-D-alanine-endopeptidase n=1 Tax=Zobellella taiwanensis TaxID=347535 RepID=A0A2P7QQI4_9GAMM|nr:D-alanyl-D-alanine carboxypeptidase/D-alanyl-D-alanine-endopeptidase [Zobellella taiwanensis]PSJ40228.1 D-alanyl-D-alanine carboxypeptidase/D-alanyl-D-alanine-endopeptidase [Zobellella taiwanensis]
MTRKAFTGLTMLLVLAFGSRAATPPEHGQAAWLLADLGSGRIEQSHNPELLLKPASTQKLLTSLAGALALGPDWRYETRLRYRGQLENGLLVGDLLIDFVGDPSLTREQLRDLLAGSGIRRISGNLLLNQSRFGGYDRGNGWSWNDLGVCYTAPPAALILDRNCVQGALYARLGQPARATVPAHQPVSVSAEVEVLGEAERRARFCELEVEMSPPNRYHLSGCTGPRQEPWPLRFAIQDLDAWGQALSRWALGQAGIALSGEIHASRQQAADWPVLASHASPPLRELVQRILIHSDNLHADSLLRTLGAERFGQPGSFRNGSQAVRDILLEQAGIDLGPAWLADGSGLSAHNLLRAADLLAVLQTMAARPELGWLVDALPVSGESGTLQYRNSVLQPPLKGRVRAKTGTIAHVQNLAGFIDTDGGRKAFVLLQNGLSISPEQQQQLARGEGEWPARAFERQWLEDALNQDLIGRTNQSTMD